MVHDPLLQVTDLSVKFGEGSRTTSVLRDVSLTLARGETVGVVGPSGCGKTTLGRAILGLIEGPGATMSGQILLDGQPGFDRDFRRRVQMVWQDPYGSLDPRMRIGNAIAEPMRVHMGLRGRSLRHRVHELLEQVGMTAPDAKRFPNAFSGGQRQRIAIARALALEPDVLICDEPTSALDVSVQARVLHLLHDLSEERGLAMLFISHDMAVVNMMSSRIIVLDAGRIVESGPASEVIAHPNHDVAKRLVGIARSRAS